MTLTNLMYKSIHDVSLYCAIMTIKKNLDNFYYCILIFYLIILKYIFFRFFLYFKSLDLILV